MNLFLIETQRIALKVDYLLFAYEANTSTVQCVSMRLLAMINSNCSHIAMCMRRSHQSINAFQNFRDMSMCPIYLNQLNQLEWIYSTSI